MSSKGTVTVLGINGHIGASAAQAFVHAQRNRLVGMDRFGTAAQDAGIAGFEAEPGSVGGDVGPRFVNDGDDP